MGTSISLRKIEIALTTLALQQEADSKEIKAIHNDMEKLLDPKNGVFSRIAKVETYTQLEVEKLHGEMKVEKTKIGFIMGGIAATITMVINFLIKKLS